ncbi:DNA-binding MarR family transcriptional regulator [Marmoricola sp. URHA0025 HA25]
MSRLRTRFEDADESAGLLLWQVTNRWQASQRAVLKPFGLTHVQFVLLASLAWLSSDDPAAPPVSQRVLADHAATDPMMTSQVVRALEGKGWLTREPHPGDGRAFALRISAVGVALVQQAVKAVEQCDEDFFDALGSGAEAFRLALRTLREASTGSTTGR